MSDHCRRQWPNIKPALAQSLVSAWVPTAVAQQTGVVGLMLAHFPRRWPSFRPTMGLKIALSGVAKKLIHVYVLPI